MQLFFKRFIKFSLISLILLIMAIFSIDFITGYLVKDRLYKDINKLPYREYAVVLGTAKYFPSGRDNLYYKYRLNATFEIFKHKKAKYFLLSGDNSSRYYNEPKNMTKDLHKKGIPNDLLRQDYRGYSTLSSIIRADETFHLPKFTIVSQQFHCERALLIAKVHNIDAICFVAQHPEGHYKVRIREYFARVRMLIDFGLFYFKENNE
ncbi:vancomycin high temperature exclusion protein [Phocoenobacter uteri]|uniref:Vancomycin high temperature exclusion protein n=1 Tax=Phocoenobacter uteri TaxID=146806 RepID=A0A379CAP7_9PAST|nr:ElyC/SanA/YdcF family protein [Phocoenobacter uteri]MDG6882613.1 hypothetical protein [Phocoenobacter uteri]SUB58776.1 vancomycin high temperature exclusion protein [Phocoenobacter uteri]